MSEGGPRPKPVPWAGVDGRCSAAAAIVEGSRAQKSAGGHATRGQGGGVGSCGTAEVRLAVHVHLILFV